MQQYLTIATGGNMAVTTEVSRQAGLQVGIEALQFSGATQQPSQAWRGLVEAVGHQS